MAAVQRRSWVSGCAVIFPPHRPPPPAAELLARWCDQLIGAGGQAWPFVVEEDDSVIGAVLARLSPEEGTGEIWGLSVEPGAWGHGHGRRLLEAGTARLVEAGLESAVSWVPEAGARARDLYQRGGWEPDGASRRVGPGTAEIVELRYRRALP